MQRKVLRRKVVDPEILKMASKYDNNPEAILEILLDVHNSQGVINEGSIEDIARAIRIPPERAYGIATFYSMLQSPKKTIRICDGPACWLKGAGEVHSAVTSSANSEVDSTAQGWVVERSSCLGLCDLAPAALFGDDQVGPVDVEHISDFFTSRRTSIPIYDQPKPGEERILLKNVEDIDPFRIDSAVEFGAYQSLEKVLGEPQENIITELEASGLRGRGGAGFPVGRKWRYVAEAESEEKIIICNADESEPLTFKDRVLIDANPHNIIEGMLVAGYAVGAQTGYIYIRGEYTSQAAKLEKAILQAKERGWLGENILGSNFSFHIHLHRGAGAYICGEETALIESLEGKRGEPRIRPPYPASYGYHGYPTVVNNVESFAYVPDIVNHGGDWYLTIGDPDMPGTKLFTLLGHVNQPGLFEAPFSLTVREAIDKFGGGMSPGSEFHFALTGGAAGTIVSSEYLDIPIGYTSQDNGLSLGSGAILICDKSISPVTLLRELMFFFEVESCGKCTPCRIGTRNARIVLDRLISKGKSNGDYEALEDLARMLKNASFCGLGQAAAMPIQSAMNNFEPLFKQG